MNRLIAALLLVVPCFSQVTAQLTCVDKKQQICLNQEGSWGPVTLLTTPPPELNWVNCALLLSGTPELNEGASYLEQSSYFEQSPVAIPHLSQKWLDDTAKRWQHILLLDDWEIMPSFTGLSDLPKGSVGSSKVFQVRKLVVVRVLGPLDYERMTEEYHLHPITGEDITKDIENTVLHELLHLRLRELSLAAQQEQVDAEEVVVSRLTSAMLGLESNVR